MILKKLLKKRNKKKKLKQ